MDTKNLFFDFWDFKFKPASDITHDRVIQGNPAGQYLFRDFIIYDHLIDFEGICWKEKRFDVYFKNFPGGSPCRVILQDVATEKTIEKKGKSYTYQVGEIQLECLVKSEKIVAMRMLNYDELLSKYEFRYKTDRSKWHPLEEGLVKMVVRNVEIPYLDKMGFSLVKDAKEDEIRVFRLAEGWTVKEDGRLWQYAYDQQGRERFSIFIGSTENSNGIYIKNRYIWKVSSFEEDSKEKYVGQVFDQDQLIYSTKEFIDDPNNCFLSEKDRILKAYQKASQESMEWLNANYPDWKDPLAYW